MMQTPARTRAKTTISRRAAWLIFAALCVVALGALAWRFVPVIGPTSTAWGFCDDLTHQRYAALYARFTPTIRAQLSQATFTLAEQLADQQAGKVTQCDASPLNVSLTGGAATAQVAEHRAGGIAVVETLHLAGPHWQIATIPDPAVAPFAVAQGFCAALLAHDYAAAYRLLTPAITAQLSQANYVKLGQVADANEGPVTACAISQLALSKDNASATASARVQRQQAAMVTIQLAQQNSAWAITNLPTA
jgi:hypothetical protein